MRITESETSTVFFPSVILLSLINQSEKASLIFQWLPIETISHSYQVGGQYVIGCNQEYYFPRNNLTSRRKKIISSCSKHTF